MAKLTDEMKKIIGENQCFVATAGKDGFPNVVSKGSTQVLDDETLMFVEIAGKKTFQNLSANPMVSIAVLNRERKDGYQFRGKAELLNEGELFDNAADKFKERGYQVKAIVKVKVDEIYPLNPKRA